MIELKVAGKIVLNCSAAGLRASPGTGIYSMSKFAVRAMTMTAGQELAQYGIRVNCVCPGIIDTPQARQYETVVAAAMVTPFSELLIMSKLYFLLTAGDRTIGPSV